jgi:hypothetical protein
MPDDSNFEFEASIMPVHLQYNFLARDAIPLHNVKNSRDVEPNLIQGLTNEPLQIPSHVVLNQANFHKTEVSSQIESVAITQRLSRSKYMTLVYYKGTEV